MRIHAADYKLLEIFAAVVNARGISNAQAVLGKDSSTISRAIAQLEGRLGIHLCDRGRQGFSITPEGFEVYQSSQALFASTRRLENKIESLKTGAEGKLKIGMIDNIVSDPNCPLTKVLADFSKAGAHSHGVQASIAVLSPDQMEHQLEQRQIDLAIGIFQAQKSNLQYQGLYQEIDYLYCSSQNPMSRLRNDDEIRNALQSQRFVARNFLDGSELQLLDVKVRDDFVFTENLEAVTQLIVSNLCVGFIPHHYAANWVEKGQICAVLKRKIVRYSDIKVAYNKDSVLLRPAVTSFLNALVEYSQSSSSLRISQV